MLPAVENAQHITVHPLNCDMQLTLKKAKRRPRASTCTNCFQKVLQPLKFALALVCFLAVIIYMILVMALQGIGMLGMYLVMPSFMRHVYPQRVGKLHTVFLGLYRRLFLGSDGHSRSIRVDLLASGSSVDTVEDINTSATFMMGGRADIAPLLVPLDGARANVPPLAYSVHTVACLLDNYAYIIVDRSRGPPYAVAFVDPCEPAAILRALQSLSEVDYAGAELEPVAILTTHHHWDHAAGNRELCAHFRNLKVYGGEDDLVDACTHRLQDGDSLRVGGLTLHALHVPCHTRGSLVYVISGPTPAMFGGDTIFCGGCGAPFEGTQAEMAANFVKIWRCCPLNTLYFPGHEYAQTILPGYLSGSAAFPENPAIFAKLCSAIWRAHRLRSQHSPVPTVPFVLADELPLNSNFAPLRRAAEQLASAYLQYENMQYALSNHEKDLLPASTASPPPSPPAQGDSSVTSSTQSSHGTMPGVMPSSFMTTDSGQGHCGTAGMVMIPVDQLTALEQALEKNGATPAVKRMLLSLRTSGCMTASPAETGPPMHVHVAHAEVPQYYESFNEMVTQTETQQAFDLLSSGLPSHVHPRTLRRALTSNLLVYRPLTSTQVSRLLDEVGVNERGLISAERFNTRFSVMPPISKEPKLPLSTRCFACFRFMQSNPPRDCKRYMATDDTSEDGGNSAQDSISTVA